MAFSPAYSINYNVTGGGVVYGDLRRRAAAKRSNYRTLPLHGDCANRSTDQASGNHVLKLHKG